MEYSFDVETAKIYGTDEAIMIKNFQFWILKNKANNKHFYDGRTWTFNSAEAFTELYPFWTAKQIRRILQSLRDKGILITGNYNKNNYDRTFWYAFLDESIFLNGKMEVTKRENPFSETVTPIPDNKPDNKPDKYIYILDFWNQFTNLRKTSQLIASKHIKKKHCDLISDYGIDTVKKAIKNYSEILESEEYFFKYSWSLWDFISRGLHNFIDDANPFTNYKRSDVDLAEIKRKKEIDDYIQEVREEEKREKLKEK